MLKKTLKKALAVALTAVTLVTSAMPVSASTLTPKKSHSDSQVQERVQYLIFAADDIAFAPWKSASGDLGDGTYATRHNIYSYRAYQMCDLLLATPNLTSACSSEEIADLKQARSTWKKAYITSIMYLYYEKVWFETELLAGDTLSYTKVSKKATSSYNRIKTYIERYKKYNPEFAKYLASYSKKQYQGYKAYVKVLKGLTPAKINKIERRWGGCNTDTISDTYKCFSKYGVYSSASCGAVDTLRSRVSTWAWDTKGYTPFNTSKDSPHMVFMRNTKYTAW